MILGMSVGAFTILHVIITLVAIGSGLIVVGGMFASNRLPVTTALFLFTTALTSLTGFLFPIHGFTPALGVGIVACVILAIALFALYKEHPHAQQQHNGIEVDRLIGFFKTRSPGFQGR